MKHIFCAIALAVIPLQSMERAVTPFKIEPFKKDRDMFAVEKILQANPVAIDYHHSIIDNEILDPDGNTDVLITNNTTVGVITYSTQRDVTSCFNPCNKYGYVRLVVVDKDHRNNGYGLALLQHAVSNMEKKDVSYIYLITSKNNAAAKKVYQHAGFSSDTTLLPFFDIDRYLRSGLQFLPGVNNNREFVYKNYAPEAVQHKQAVITRTMEKCTLAGLLAVYLWKMI